MSINANDNEDGTPRSSHLSPTSASLSPTWLPPKSPLPPHRLAKLANALGVSTPIPVSNGSPGMYITRSFSDSLSPTDSFGRSPTPSASPSSMGFSSHSPATSKYLLHVIPPSYLPHDSGGSGESRRLPTPNAPGYHRQFRRGTLVPVHATLQAQLGAIAREYALPSTSGIILYLINSTPQSPLSVEDTDEPGPRLSEDIWRHLWTRVLRAERMDDTLLSSRSPTPLTPHMPHLYNPSAQSTPSLPQERSPSPLRPLMASTSGPHPILTHAPHPTYPPIPATTAPSTPSSVSDLRSNSKSAPPSSVSQSEPDTPDTSVEDSGLRGDSLELPGLTSTSLIPILAKVEFDIDRRKAAWYEPWLRSRKANQAKRNTSRNGQREGDGDISPQNGRSAPLTLLTVNKSQRRKKDPLGLSTEPDLEAEGYARLSESPLQYSDGESDYDDEDYEDMEDLTARVSSPAAGDIRAEGSGQKRKKRNPNVVDLALTGEELSALPDVRDLDRDRDEDAESSSTREEAEVMKMLEKMGNPTMVNGKKTVPTLTVKTGATEGIDVAIQTPNSTDLAYMEPSREDQDDYARQRDSEKRGGTVFDDLDLGLDPTEDYLNDPLDHRRSQLMMRAQLDEIERTMAQLSPRVLDMDLSEQQDLTFNTSTLSTSSPVKRSMSPMLSPGRSSSELMPSSPPRLPKHPDPPGSPPDGEGASWPAVPFSAIKGQMGQSTVNPNAPPSPPRLAVNGITTSAPKSFIPARGASIGATESEKRRREQEEENALYPRRGASKDLSPADSVIPLSPDPFGRYPSSPEPPTPASLQDTATQRGDDPAPRQADAAHTRNRSGTTTSRFSADSISGDEPAAIMPKSNRSTLMSVKSIKNLWRKSKEKTPSVSTNSLPPIPSVPSSGRNSPMVPQRPDRPSQENMDLPDMPDIPAPTNFGRLSPQLMPQTRSSLDQGGRRTPQEMMPPARVSMDQLNPGSSQQLGIPQFQMRPNPGPITTPHMRQASRSTGNLDRLHFDQESPYPTRVTSTAPRQSPRPPSPPQLPAIPEKDQPAPPPQEQEKNTTRKSILKWRSGNNNANGTHKSTGSTSEPQPRQSFERPNTANGGGRGRRPSVINFGSTRAASVSSQEIPKSPPLPSQFASQANPTSGASSSPPFKQPVPSTRSVSPQRSMASSRDSIGSRPSFDVSQFEFVSPQAGGTLNYPYTADDSR
ncbi:hypothetical protein CPB83DRAFT_785578 [Crepidotus variabilis]|uniref:Uncharacterized protein n=1 Tax=Crepidotus variabilis TaxID=179855 RepID=A0A9P6EMR7_9AGAR|nr:hypothetical protein CPB83DRAFT_785578 [Crepidotus variabilis]